MHKLHAIWHHPIAHWTRLLLISIIGGWMGVLLWGGGKVSINLATLHGSVAPAISGWTTIDLPPFGSISAHTHHAPLHVQLRVDSLHADALMQWVTSGSTREDTVILLRHALLRFALTLAVYAISIAALAGGVLNFLLRRQRREWLLGTLAATLGVALPLLVAYGTYSAAAFANPLYRGELARAPNLLQAVQQGWKNYASLEERVPLVIDRMIRFYRQLDAVAVAPMPSESGMRRVLHISDLHNNPLGLKFAQDLAREYRVDVVVMTGDTTDLGHPLEAELLNRWKNFSVPVVMIAGNHDSRVIMQRLASIPNITVLDNGRMVTRAGLTMMGFGDPAAERAGAGNVNATADELRELRDRISARLATGPTPDLLLVHTPRTARAFLGRVPIITTGHTHSPQLLRKEDSAMINPGTTGAAGLRYFTGPHQPPYGAAVLHITRDEPARLQYVDFIEMDEPAGNFAIRRMNMAARPVEQGVAKMPGTTRLGE